MSHQNVRQTTSLMVKFNILEKCILILTLGHNDCTVNVCGEVDSTFQGGVHFIWIKYEQSIHIKESLCQSCPTSCWLT